ncbi:MAG: hypothetical protein WC376_02610 [Candidatus Nanoarchaeia archaeon]|jgi:hypothetical protein
MIRNSIIKRFDELIQKCKEFRDYKVPLKNEEVKDFYKWGHSCLNILDRTFSQKSSYYKSFKDSAPTIDRLQSLYGDYISNYSVTISRLQGLLESALDEINNGFLYKIENLIAGDFFESISDQAEELLKKHFKDPTAVLLRVVIETTLKKICERESINYSEKERASSLNIKLRENEIYNLPMERIIQAQLDIGNYAAHGDFEKYSEEDVNKMLKFIKEDLPKL